MAAVHLSSSKLDLTQHAQRNRILTLQESGTIDRALAENQGAIHLLNSDTLAEFVADFPDFKIRDGQIPPFHKRAKDPDIESLIACHNLQWARHCLKSGKVSDERIPGVAPAMASVWQTQVPQILRRIFVTNPHFFLNGDVLWQQTVVLTTQDFVEQFFPEMSLPDDFDEIMKLLDKKAVFDLDLYAAILCGIAEIKLEKLQKKACENKESE